MLGVGNDGDGICIGEIGAHAPNVMSAAAITIRQPSLWCVAGADQVLNEEKIRCLRCMV